MEVLTRESFPVLGYDDAIRVSLNHQSILRDIRIKACGIDLDSFTIEELKEFVKFCRKKTE